MNATLTVDVCGFRNVQLITGPWTSWVKVSKMKGEGGRRRLLWEVRDKGTREARCCVTMVNPSLSYLFSLSFVLSYARPLSLFLSQTSFSSVRYLRSREGVVGVKVQRIFLALRFYFFSLIFAICHAFSPISERYFYKSMKILVHFLW